MNPHDVAGPYQVKAAEYLIAVLYLILFVPFWRFVNGGRPAAGPAPAASRRPAGGWFAVPEALRFHPGHAWVSAEDGGAVTVGLDDFARKLLGPLSAVRLPAPGAALAQGETGWTLVADGGAVDMVSPVGGTVLAANSAVARDPEVLRRDPYGEGWLLKLKPARLESDAKQLLWGGLARKWMEGVADSLRARSSPELGTLLQDGGQPVDGIARELAPEGWIELARSFLRS
jgi:glycine cleavage system H protein